MTTPGLKPTFEPHENLLKTGWYVLVTWPDGTHQTVAGFSSELEAARWIKSSSEKWVAEQTGRS
jgi:hypothetical protein